MRRLAATASPRSDSSGSGLLRRPGPYVALIVHAAAGVIVYGDITTSEAETLNGSCVELTDTALRKVDEYRELSRAVRILD